MQYLQMKYIKDGLVWLQKNISPLKGLRKESLRDNMTDVEIALADLGELATREIAKKKNPEGLNENI